MKFKLLQVGEEAKAGDELLYTKNTNRWIPNSEWGIYTQEDQNGGLIYRRRERRTEIEVESGGDHKVKVQFEEDLLNLFQNEDGLAGSWIQTGNPTALIAAIREVAGLEDGE